LHRRCIFKKSIHLFLSLIEPLLYNLDHRMTLFELHDTLLDRKILKNPKSFIALYEANSDLIAQTDLSNIEEYKCLMNITCEYAHKLVKTGQLKKGLLFLDEATDLMESFPEYNRDYIFEVANYERAVSSKAVIFYNLRKFEKALSLYKRLNAAFPTNESYQGWIYRVKARRYGNLSWTGVVLVFADVVLRLIFDDTRFAAYNDSYWILASGISLYLFFEILRRIAKSKHKKLVECSNKEK